MRNIYRTYREHYKALFFLGLPIVIGQIGVIVLGFADTLLWEVYMEHISLHLPDRHCVTVC